MSTCYATDHEYLLLNEIYMLIGIRFVTYRWAITADYLSLITYHSFLVTHEFLITYYLLLITEI
jgi:hypothetical protein